MFYCDQVIEKAYCNICINILNQAALDYRSKDSELILDVIDFLDSDWFEIICSHYELDMERWRGLITNKRIPVKNKLILVGYK